MVILKYYPPYRLHHFKNEYNGYTAMVGYKITSNIYLTGRYDAYKEKVEDAEVKKR